MGFLFSSCEKSSDNYIQLTCCVVTTVAARKASRVSLKDMKRRSSAMERLSR